MDDYELLLCQNENKRLRGIIERLEDKVRDSSIRFATYCADYEAKIAQLKGRYIIKELDNYKSAYHYINDQYRTLIKTQEELTKYIESSLRLLEIEQSKYKDYIAASKRGLLQPVFLIEASKAIDFLNLLNAKLNAFKEYPIAEELDKMLKKNAEEKDAGVTGFRSLINPRYKAEEFLKELHKLIDGHKCKEQVPYILILLEEKALSRKPTWKEMREEFKDIGASSNSNYCKFMKFKLTPVKTGECFDEEEVLSKRSIIEDILEKYNTHFISDFPF